MQCKRMLLLVFLCKTLLQLVEAQQRQQSKERYEENGEELTTTESLIKQLIDIYELKIKPFHHNVPKLSSNTLRADGHSWRPQKWPKVDKIAISATKTHTYDFIIIGSGSAGCVLANRLSEVPSWNVLLLEAGQVENDISQIPILAPALQLTHYDWQYVMEKEPGFARGMNNGRLLYPRGKALGGTSVINYMIYTRGNPQDYDRWAAAGNPGWSYADVLPYFLKSENASLKVADARYHGTHGPLSVQDSYQSELVNAFIEAGKELGYPRVDYSSPDQIGFSTVQANIKGGRRHSVAKAFLRPIMRARKNLRVLTSALVTKILIDPATKTAYGVAYKRSSGEMRVVYAKREVIVSAGTFNSAQLLMLSGVGPKDHLTDLGISTVSDLPVGEYMQDHLTFVGLHFVIEPDVALSVRRTLNVATLKEFLYNSTGPATSLGGVEGIAYINTGTSALSPDIELLFVGAGLHSDLGLVSRRSMNIRDDVYETYWRQLEPRSGWTVFPMLLHPKSYGRLRLRTGNPHDPPIMNGNYFSDARGEDVRTMIAAIRFVVRLAEETEAFRAYGSRLWRQVAVPGCEIYAHGTDAYWECALRTLSITLHHQVATCKMGPGGVVDPWLRVYGVRRLRVADSSVIPFALGAHTNAPAIMVGEKAADLIKNTWGM